MSAVPVEPSARRGTSDRTFVVSTTNDVARWNAFVASVAGSTFCHQAGWRDVMQSVLGHETSLLVATDETGEWRGVLPLVRVRSILGRYSISMPFMNDGGPLGDDDAIAALVEFAVADAEKSGAKLLELRSRRMLPGRVSPSGRKVAVHLSLPSTV